MVCFTTEPIATQISYTNLTTNNTAEAITAIAPLDAKYLLVYFYNSTDDTDTVETLVNSIMINTGSTALPYEPYGYKLPLTVNGMEYPIYLGQVETTRRIKKLVFDGTEPWNRSTSGNNTRAYTPQIPECMSLSPAICTHFNYNVANVGYPKVGDFVINSSKAIIFGVDGNMFADVDTWKSYLAQQYANGTPVTVWYVLATEEAAIVNEPLMKIGDYADTVSFAQSQVTIPTVNGENVLDVPTEVPPSEVTIKGGISSV